MDNPKVNIYIETTVHGPAEHGGRGMYLLEYVLRTGDPVTRYAVTEWQDWKENELVLNLMAAALARINTSCIVTVCTTCGYVRDTIETERLERWSRNGWITARGREVKHRKLWQRIAELTEAHLVFVETGPHSYRKWMRTELEKENSNGR